MHEIVRARWMLISILLFSVFACQGPIPAEEPLEKVDTPTQTPAEIEPTKPSNTATPTLLPVTIRVLMDDNPKNGEINIEVLEGDYQLANGTTLWSGSKIWAEEQYLTFPVGLAIEVGPAGLTLKGVKYPGGTTLFFDRENHLMTVGDTATASSDKPVDPVFRDDFDGSLGEGWQWLGEDTSHWNLTDAPGFLRIILQPCNIAPDGRARNFLVRAIPEGDFQIETYIIFEPSSNYQFAGLLIYETQGKAMQFGRAFADCGFDACKGNAIYFDLADPGAVSPPNFVTRVDENSQAWLRLVRTGNRYEGYYSADGKTWMSIGAHTSDIVPVYVGLIGSQAYEAETTADFDYFVIEQIP